MPANYDIRHELTNTAREDIAEQLDDAAEAVSPLTIRAEQYAEREERGEDEYFEYMMDKRFDPS